MDIIDNYLHKKGAEKLSGTARTVRFGEVTVRENLDANLVSNHEASIYRNGFATWQKVLQNAPKRAKNLLLNPRTVSLLIGLQPRVYFPLDQAETVTRALTAAGKEYENTYAVFEIENTARWGVSLVNLAAAGEVVRQNAVALRLHVNDTLSNEKLMQLISSIYSQSARDGHLLDGLLSGYPLADCMWWLTSEATEQRPLGTAKFIENPQDYFATKKLKSYPNDTTPTTTGTWDERPGLYINGLGLTWWSRRPLGKTTLTHLQKLLQVDRMLGFTKFVPHALEIVGR